MTTESRASLLAMLKKLNARRTQGDFQMGRRDMLSESLDDEGLYKQVYGKALQPRMHMGSELPFTVARFYGHTSEEIFANAELFENIPAMIKALQEQENELARLKRERDSLYNVVDEVLNHWEKDAASTTGGIAFIYHNSKAYLKRVLKEAGDAPVAQWSCEGEHQEVLDALREC